MVRHEPCANAISVEGDVREDPRCAVNIDGGGSIQNNPFERDPLVVFPNDTCLASDLALDIAQNKAWRKAVEGNDGSAAIKRHSVDAAHRT